MNISTVKEKILNAILIAERVTGKKESLPILSCVLLDVGKDLIIRATNLEAGVEIRVPCDVSEKGVIAVPANVLSQTLRSIGGEKITLKTDEGNLVVESKGTRTLIKAVPHSEFPTLSGGAGSAGISISRVNLMQGISGFVCGVSIDDPSRTGERLYFHSKQRDNLRRDRFIQAR